MISMNDRSGHCSLKELMKEAIYHGLDEKDYNLVITDDLKKEYCKECKNILC